MLNKFIPAPTLPSSPRHVADFRWSLAALTALPATAFASDFTGLLWFLLALQVAAFVVIFPAIWIASRRIERPWVRILLRVVVLCAFWAPTPVDGTWITWAPAGMLVLDPPIMLIALGAVALWTVVLWTVFMGMRKLAAQGDDPPAGS